MERIDPLEIFEELFEAIVLALERISNNEDGTWQGNCIIDANGLHGTCTSFEFIVALVVSRRDFHTQNLSRYHFRKRTWRLQKDIKAYNF